MMSTEVMKNFTIMNRASVREIMLQHEKTFKEQVHDLHKLYEVQRVLMDKAKGRGLDFYLAVPSPSPTHHLHPLPEGPDQSRQKGNFWGQIPTDSVAALKADVLRQLPDTEKSVKENNILLEDKSKSTNSPMKKRKIDLEQLPEDDTDDEMEKSENVLIQAPVNPVEKPKDFTIGHTGLESTVKSCPSPNHGTGVHPSQLAKLSQVSSLVTGENSSHKNHTSASRVASVYPSQFGKAPEETPQVIKEKNTDFQNPSLLSTGGCTGKSIAVFLPQTDVIDRASQDTRRETHWFFQASDASMNPLSTPGFSSQQKQISVPHPLLPEPSFKENHQHNGIPQGHLNLGQRQLSSKPAPTEDASCTFGNWSKASVEKKPSVLVVGAHEGRLFSSQERSDNGSRWFTTEAYSQGCELASVIPAVGVDMRASEGDQSTSGSVVPVLSVVNGKGQNQEQDTNLRYSENPVMQLSQYQQQPMFRPQVFPSVNQAVWLQSSQSTHGGLHPQQIVYGVHTTDASQVGFRAEGLHRGQGDITVPWNMLGLGHYYSSVPSVPQRPHFKKPPKLVLKNDGAGMELKLVSPERESSEKVSQRKTSNPSKDLPQESLKAQERKGGVQRENKEEDMKHGETAKSTGVNIQSSTVQARGASKTSSMPLQPKVLATVTATHTQEMLLPKKKLEHTTASVYVSHGLAAPVTVSSVAQSDTGAAANMDSFTTNAHNVIASSDTVSALPYESEAQQGIRQAEIVMPQQDQVKAVENSTPLLERKEARFAKEMLLQGAVRINEDTQDLALSGQGSSLVPCKDDIEGSVTGCNNNKSRDQSDSEHVQISTSSRNSEDMKSPSNKVLMPKGNADNVNVTGQPSPFSANSQDSNLNMEESGNVASVWEKRSEELHVNQCGESVLLSKNKIDAFKDYHGHMTFDSSLSSVKCSQARADGFSLDSHTGSHLIHGVATGSSGNDDAQTKNLLQGSLRGHGSDLMSTSSQLTMQAVSTQSTSTETPGIMKQERTRSSKVLESGVFYNVSEKGSSSSVRKSKSATPNSDGGCPSVPSIKPTILQSKPDAAVGASSEDLHHDSDSDSLAATILLSFAPMIDQQNPKKHLTEDACKNVGSSCKHTSASIRTRQTGVRLTKGVMGIQCQSFEPGDDQGSRVKVQCSSRRMDHVEPIRLATKDRFREEQLSTELQSDDGGEEVIKNARSKLSKAISLGSPKNDEPIATLKSKQLNKLSVAVVNSKNVDTHDHTTMSYKGKDVFHTPTGRRSSRGPPMAARVYHGSRGRTQQQLQHYSDEEGGSPNIAEVYSRSREEGGGSPRNAQGSMKSKAWGDLNRKRSRPRSQFHSISHRKTQR